MTQWVIKLNDSCATGTLSANLITNYVHVLMHDIMTTEINFAFTNNLILKHHHTLIMPC